MTEEGSQRVGIKTNTILLSVFAEVLANDVQLGKNITVKSTASDNSLV